MSDAERGNRHTFQSDVQDQGPLNVDGIALQSSFIPVFIPNCGQPPPPYSVEVPVYPNPSNSSNPPLHGNPPAYEDCEDVDVDVPPPSYESLFGRVREVQKSSNGFIDFLKNLSILMLGTVGCAIMIGMTVVIPIVMIIIGLLKMDLCPAEKFVPIYLVVGGSFGILKNLVSFNTRFQNKMLPEDGHMPWHKRIQFTAASINFFLTAWFITGCYWVYRIYEPNYTDPSSIYYCDYTLYMFAFCLVTSVYVTAALLTSCICCLSVATAILSRIT